MSDLPPRSPPTRRALIGGLASATALVWAAPAILSVDAARAATAEPFSPVTLAGSGPFWVTQGSSGAVWTSGDGGSNWDLRTGPGFVARALGVNGVFIATSDGTSFSISTDSAQSWAPASTPPGSPPATILGQNPVVVLAPSNMLWRSTDGNTWNTISESPLLTMLTGSNAGYLGYKSGDNLWFYSANEGLTWTGTTTPPTQVPALIVGGGTSFVVVGTSAVVASTDNGSTFVPVSGLTFLPTLVAGSAGAFMATDGTGTWASSDDGQAWTANAGPGFVATLLSGYDSTTFVATDGSSWSRTSFGGTTWSPVSVPPG